MTRFRRRVPFVPLVLVAAAVAIVLAAASLTSWCVLFALIPLAMMVGCMAMLTARGGVPRDASAARFGCCGVSALAGATPDPERRGANETATSGG